jgi:hypothetical protein
MDTNQILKKISAEIMIFIRGNYYFDEIGNGVDELGFFENNENIFSIFIYNDRYEFNIDNNHISVMDMDKLEEVKTIIKNKKKPNRIPFSKENAIYSDCGHRCDLCLHFTGASFSDEFRIEIGNSISRAYSQNTKDIKFINSIEELHKYHPPCDGCSKGGLFKKYDCYQIKCAKENGVVKCVNCAKYPCDKSCAGLPPEIHTRTIYADDVTWGILPFVYKQYGN